MKLSTFHEYHAHPFDVAHLKRLKALGYDGIDFCFHPALLADGKEDLIIEGIRENFEKAGLVCSQVHLPFYDLTLPSDCYDEFVERQMRFAFKAMTVLGAKWGAWHPVSATQANHDRRIAMKDNKEKLKRHLEAAEKYGVGIAIENIFAPFFSWQVEDHIELIESMDSPLVGACWDFGHANLQKSERGQVEDFRMIADKIRILHVNDNHACEDRHLCPGIGTSKFGELLPILFSTGFDGFFNMECGVHCRTETMDMAYYDCIAKCARLLIDEAQEALGAEK